MMRNLLSRPVIIPPLVLLAVWAVVAFTTQRTIATDEERIEDLQAEQLTLVVELDELSKAEDRVQSFETDLARFAVAVPPTADLGPLLRTLDAAADATGVRIDLLAPTNVASSTTATIDRPVPSSMSSVTLSVTGIGSFTGTMELVARIEDLERLVVIDALTLTTADDDPDQIVIDLELRVFTTDVLVEDDPTLFELEEAS